MPYPY